MRKCLLNVILFLLVLLVGEVEAVAGEVTLVPTLRVRAERDDNVLFTSYSPISDYVAEITPGISADFRTERGNVNVTADIDVLRYAQNTNLDRENERVAVVAGYALTELLQGRMSAAYINDTTLDTQLLETGIVTVFQDVERYSGGAGLTYRLSPRADLGVEMFYESVIYGGPSVDYQNFRVSFPYNWLLPNAKSTLTVLPNYEAYTSDVSDVNNYGMSFGLAHPFTETWNLRAFVGVRYTQTDYRFVQQEVVFDPSLLPAYPFRVVPREVNVTDSNWAGVADLSITKKGEAYEWSLGYVHDLTYSSGQPVNLHRVYGTYQRSLTSRLGFVLTASAYDSEQQGAFDQTDYQYFDGSFIVFYKLTENHRLQAGYRYRVQWEDSAQQNQKIDDNMFFVSLALAFPKKW
jgi:outer membrane protein assembly factor BamA